MPRLPLYIRIFVIGSLVLLILSISVPTTFALKGTSVLTTSPIATDLVAQPGQSTSTTLQVQNNGSTSIQVSVKVEEFKANGTNGDATFYTPPPGDKSTSWVHFSSTSFTAPPNVWVPIQMTIDVPKDASLGYYYAVLFTPDTTVKAGNTSDRYRGSNAIYVLVNTNSKNESKNLVVSNFTTNKRLYSFLPVKFNIEVSNPGNIFIAPEGYIYISRKVGGKTIDTIQINKAGSNILPSSSRIFSAQWSDGFPSHVYKRVNGQVVTSSKGQPEEELDWNTSSSLSKFRFGKYYANLAIVYNNGTLDVPINGVVSFWVIPWVLILEILVALTAIIVLWKIITKTIKRLWRKLFKKEHKENISKKPSKTKQQSQDTKNTNQEY